MDCKGSTTVVAAHFGGASLGEDLFELFSGETPQHLQQRFLGTPAAILDFVGRQRRRAIPLIDPADEKFGIPFPERDNVQAFQGLDESAHPLRGTGRERFNHEATPFSRGGIAPDRQARLNLLGLLQVCFELSRYASVHQGELTDVGITLYPRAHDLEQAGACHPGSLVHALVHIEHPPHPAVGPGIRDHGLGPSCAPQENLQAFGEDRTSLEQQCRCKQFHETAAGLGLKVGVPSTHSVPECTGLEHRKTNVFGSRKDPNNPGRGGNFHHSPSVAGARAELRVPSWVMPTESRIRVALALHEVFGRGNRVPESWDDGLASEDAGLAQALLGLSLRHWGRLQAWIRPRLKNPDRDIPLGSRVALSMGLAQLAWLPGVLTHAAVNESVSLAAHPDLGFPPHKGLTNALLRQAARDRSALLAELDALPPALDRTPFTERVLRSALVPRTQEVHLEKLWRILQQPPRPAFQALATGPLPEGLAPDPDLPTALRLLPAHPFPRPWLAAGQGMVQDLSSQALMGFAWGGTPRRILDACAAPGGKTTSLARRWPKADLIALESDPRRAERLERGLAVRQVAAQVIISEAAAWLRRETTRDLDLILIDAPCSGSGTLRKHPELNWLGDGLDLPPLVATQRSLLDAALSRLAPGGLLVYAVCSWLPEEGLHHQERLQATRPELESASLWPSHLATQDGEGQVFRPDPLRWEGEGFQAFGFICRG